MPRSRSTITTPAKGGFKPKQLVSALPPKFSGSNLSAEIVITADGRFLYVSNRLHNTVAIFAVADDGQLRMISETWVHADYPRCLTIDPSGEFLYSCNQKGDSITSFRINRGIRRPAIHRPLRTGGKSRGHGHAETFLSCGGPRSRCTSPRAEIYTRR